MSGDARLELWEKLCTCGGARKSPDVRMCRCLAPEQAGLDCDGCGRGVLLIKQAGTTGRLFWGCSNYKKGGCKFTRKFGPPCDREAVQQLERIGAGEKPEREKLERIVDQHELEWRSNCRCEGAKHLITFECYMQSEGGCGFMPICPLCGAALFLKDGIYGQYWHCQTRPVCNYRKSYEPHAASEERKKPRTELKRSALQNASNNSSKVFSPEREIEITPKQHSSSETEAKTATSAKMKSTTGVANESKPLSLSKIFDAHVKSSRLEKTQVMPTQSLAPASIPNSPLILSPEEKSMIEGKRQAAIAKRRSMLAKQAALTKKTDVTVATTPTQCFAPVTVASPRTIVLSPEQKAMIEASRQAAIAKHQSLLENKKVKTEKASDSVAIKANQNMLSSPTRNVTSAKPATTASFAVLSPEQKSMIEAKRQAAITRRQRTLATQQATKTSMPQSFAVCQNPQNYALYQAFCELAQLYQKEGNYYARATYDKASKAISKLDAEVTVETAMVMAKGKKKVPNIGKASADKMYEFVTTGKIGKLDEKKTALKETTD